MPTVVIWLLAYTCALPTSIYTYWTKHLIGTALPDTRRADKTGEEEEAPAAACVGGPIANEIARALAI